ncbi:SpoIIE family protein phosphatase [Amycolatopsis plumensis]|uniref:SpoIIE family protein phosphatase n=1 Tax=Amycolatopsis plumensis TaxID=236508 RepID=UPI0036108593
MGHGLAAATVMGQLRSACRALLLEHPTPAAALAALDRFAARLPGATCTTAFCAVLTPETGELAYSSAGHPPPVLVHADRTTQLLEDGHSIPLGVRTGLDRPEARVVIPPRGTLLLYTDGLVERRRDPLDEGITRVAELLENSASATPDELADKLMTSLAPAAGYEDDVAVLLYRQPGPLEIGFPADAGQLAPTRRALRGWLDRCGLGAEQVQNVLVATGEAVANAIEHGHRDTPGGPIRLNAIALADRVHVTVNDTGTWKPPQAAATFRRGRGMMLMRELVTEVDVHQTTDGTTVHLHARITA